MIMVTKIYIHAFMNGMFSLNLSKKKQLFSMCIKGYLFLLT